MSFFRYPGGKHKLKKEILKELSELIYKDNRGYEYREPFFGGGSIGILVLNEFSGMYGVNDFWINDKDSTLACVWTSVIKYPEELKNYIMEFVPVQEKFFEYKKEISDAKDIKTSKLDKNKIVEYGFKKIALHQMSYSGLGAKAGGPIGGKEQKSDYDIGCRWSPEYLCKKIDKTNKMFKSVGVRKNQCTNEEYYVVIEDDEKEAAIYLDPPYFIKGNELYMHGFTEEEHERLSIELKKTKHKWLLSYDDCEEIRKLYSWANIKEISVGYSINGATKKPELLIKNAD